MITVDPDTSPEQAFRIYLESLDGGEATKRLLDRLSASEMPSCPCCGRRVKLYKRKLYWKMAAFIVELAVRDLSGAWQDIAKWPKAFKQGILDGGDYGKVQLWRLAERFYDPAKGGRSGLWRPLIEGKLFAFGCIRIPREIWTYNGIVFGRSGQLISVRGALENHFDYEEALGRTP